MEGSWHRRCVSQVPPPGCSSPLAHALRLSLEYPRLPCVGASAYSALAPHPRLAWGMLQAAAAWAGGVRRLSQGARARWALLQQEVHHRLLVLHHLLHRLLVLLHRLLVLLEPRHQLLGPRVPLEHLVVDLEEVEQRRRGLLLLRAAALLLLLRRLCLWEWACRPWRLCLRLWVGSVLGLCEAF